MPRRIREGADVAGRGRAALELRDRGQARPGQRISKASHLREPREVVEARAGGAGIDRLGGEGEPLAQVGGVPGGRDRAGRVEQDGVALPAAGAREDVADAARVFLGRAAAQLFGVAPLEPELGGVDRALDHLAADDLADEVRPRRRQLVDARVAVHDEGAVGAELGDHLGDGADEPGRVDADHLRPRTGRVGERAEHVEDGARGELACARAQHAAWPGGGAART